MVYEERDSEDDMPLHDVLLLQKRTQVVTSTVVVSDVVTKKKRGRPSKVVEEPQSELTTQPSTSGTQRFSKRLQKEKN